MISYRHHLPLSVMIIVGSAASLYAHILSYTTSAIYNWLPLVYHTCSLFLTLAYTDSNSHRNCTRAGDQSSITAGNINNEAVP